MTETLPQLFDKALKTEKATLKDAKQSLATFASAIVKEESVQNAAILKNKSFQLNTKIRAVENRIKYIELIKSQKGEEAEKKAQLERFEVGLVPQTSECEYVWQVVGNIEAIEKANVTFITDKHVFLHGEMVFAVLAETMKTKSIEMVNLVDDPQHKKSAVISEGVDNLWDQIESYAKATTKPIFFLDLEQLTPSKILLLGRLQKHFQVEKNSNNASSNNLQIILYAHDVLSSQLKTASFQPDLEVEFIAHQMPVRINYVTSETAAAAATQYTTQSRSREIKRIIEESIEKYKKSFMRFDIILFMQSQQETEYLIEHSLSFIKEPLNIINLTEESLEVPEIAILAKKAKEIAAAERKAAEEKAAEEKAAAEQKAAEQKAAEEKSAEQLAADKKAAEENAAAEVAKMSIEAPSVQEVFPHLQPMVVVVNPEEAKPEAEPVPVLVPVIPATEEDYSMLEQSAIGIQSYEKGAFNVIIAKSHKQIRNYSLDNVLIQIDCGETHKLYFSDTIVEGIPTLSTRITREEALKRERLMGHTVCGEIFRLYSRKEFLRLQKRDYLNTLNFQNVKNFEEIGAETCPEMQALRILVHLVINQSERWFTCSTEAGAHVSLLWSRMGDVFSLANCIQSIPTDDKERLTANSDRLLRLIEKNQIDPIRFDRLICDINSTARLLVQKNDYMLPYLDFVGVIQKMDKQKLSESLQRIVIKKYYRNLCVYSGHRRHGFKHFASGQSLHYAEQSSMNLIQERPFLMIPMQLSINSKNHLEVKQCIAVDHMIFLEVAPSEFIEKHKLRLLKRQSLNLHEIEYFGISTALFQHFTKNEKIVRDFEAQFDCYYEPNLLMDTITIHCDSASKEKIEKTFRAMIEAAQKELNEEVMEVANGKNSIIKIEKGGIVKEVVIFENDHEFFVDNLPLTVKEEELIEMFSEYGEILKVRLFEGKLEDAETGGKTLSAEILVADSEDSAFFVEVFDQNIFQGRNITVRNKSHQFKLRNLAEPTKYSSIVTWNTWKSKCTGTIEFDDESVQIEFMKLVSTGFTVDGNSVKVEVNKYIMGKRGVSLSNLNKITDEETIKNSIEESMRKNILSIHVDRIPDLDRGTSKMRLSFLLNEIYGNQQEIKWIRRKQYGFVEAKISFTKNRVDYMYELDQCNKEAGKLGLQKMYIKHKFSHVFNFDIKMEKILSTIIDGNEQILDMQKKKQITLHTSIGRSVPSKQEILVKLKSEDQSLFDDSKYYMKELLNPRIVDIQNMCKDEWQTEDFDSSQMFTQTGLKILKELEEKYAASFRVNLQKQEISVFCTEKIHTLIYKEIEQFLRQNIRVKIPVSGKNIRNILGTDGKGLEALTTKFELVKIELDYISKDVYMQGGAKQVDSASNALLALLEENNSSTFANSMPYSYEDCQVCAETIQTGYRLQGCGHKFCMNCIQFVIDNSLKDVNSFPIKCPCCSVPLVLRDIMAVMSEEQIEKMYRMSLNKHVQTHFETLTFCVSENCRSVHSSALSKYTCYECKKTYCAKCSAEYHFGLTCTKYQETEAKNIEYLIKEGARKCPKCSVFIIRIDGCYRVECQRCNSHICWKDNCMKYYDNSSDCYNHLDEMHGGYW